MLLLKEFQKKAIDSFNQPQDPKHVLCLAPTGSGKSLIYETLAMQVPQRLLLITPLIALAHQQALQLKAKGVPVFFGLEGSTEAPQGKESGAWIVSPEALQSRRRQAILKAWEPTLLVIDECHCIWEWGTAQFRPPFAEIPKLIEQFSIPQSLWLTATLPLQQQSELKTLFGKQFIQIGEFDFPASLFLSLQQISLTDRMSYLTQWLSLQTQAGMIFVSTRSATERLARLLAPLQRRIITYHAGMAIEEKRNLEAQIRNRDVDLVISTSAFGMGMNYPHLSYVVLWQIPPTVLSLVQAIGRVGRGSQPKNHALVLWDLEDFELLSWTLQGSSKKMQDLLELKALLQSKECRTLSFKRFFGSQSLSSFCGRCDFCALLSKEGV